MTEVCRQVVSSMHAPFAQEVQSFRKLLVPQDGNSRYRVSNGNSRGRLMMIGIGQLVVRGRLSVQPRTCERASSPWWLFGASTGQEAPARDGAHRRPRAYGNGRSREQSLRLFGNCRQVKLHPAIPLVLEDMANQIVDMQTLHHQNDDACLLVVEPGRESRLEPADDGLPSYLPHGVFRFKRVIDDDVGATIPVRVPPTEVA